MLLAEYNGASSFYAVNPYPCFAGVLLDDGAVGQLKLHAASWRNSQAT